MPSMTLVLSLGVGNNFCEPFRFIENESGTKYENSRRIPVAFLSVE